MNGREIVHKLSQYPATRGLFKGVFSSDLLPRSKKTPFCFIANTEPHDDPGEHWVAFFVFATHIEFFDSYGRAPNNPMFPKSFSRYVANKNCVYNARLLEGFFSKTCGQFCIFYICMRSSGVSYKKMINSLSVNCHINDYIVRKL